MDPKTGCPADYAELFVEYFPMMRAIVSRSGIEKADVEDVAMDILARFIEKDGIAYYDPDMLHDIGESAESTGARFRKAKFKAMLRGFTSTYVMQYRDKQMTRHRRIPWSLEGYFSAPDEESDNARNAVPDDRDLILDVEVSSHIVAALLRARAELIARSTRAKDYGTFLDLLVENATLDGKVDRLSIANQMGVSRSTVTTMVKDLRSALHRHLGDAAA